MTVEEREPRKLPDLSHAAWRKSSLSGNGGADCVEVAIVSGTDKPRPSTHLFAVRDSKNPDGPKLLFTSSQWAAFVSDIKRGEFDT
ncbi:DUF397 domain-containing protein [Streptosporangium subroseum]|uniref:DUF397 domain-containing protein n=1 Tax=Streptosporangium subroseum TaxID=106412 RepID=UPI003087A0DA|nr:DUF397 domain-containing protein [Streptosporangium subroseum]